MRSGFSKWKKVPGGNWKIAGAPMRRASGVGRQSRPWGGCGRGFPPPAGGVWKNWKSACSEVHSGAFSGPKSYFLGRCSRYYNLEFFWKLCFLIHITMLFPCYRLHPNKNWPLSLISTSLTSYNMNQLLKFIFAVRVFQLIENKDEQFHDQRVKETKHSYFGLT